MDTSTAPLARVRSNRALISAVRHRSNYMREATAATAVPDLSLSLVQGEEEEEGDEVEVDEDATEHREPTAADTTTTASAAAVPAAVGLSQARREKADGRPAARSTRTSQASVPSIGIGKRERTASLSSSSSSSSYLILSSPDEGATHAPSGVTNGGQLNARFTKIAKFDNNENDSARTQPTVAWPSPPSSTTPRQQPRLLKKRTTRRRTETSYDEVTTNYLKRVFFEVYGHGRKLTKVERRAIEADTGLMSRKITYWFSNQKRRFSAELKAFQRLSSQGCVKTYDDFLIWCKDNYAAELATMPQTKEDAEERRNPACMDDSKVSLQSTQTVTLARPS